jgi:hypothetical protein
LHKEVLQRYLFNPTCSSIGTINKVFWSITLEGMPQKKTCVRWNKIGFILPRTEDYLPAILMQLVL